MSMATKDCWQTPPALLARVKYFFGGEYFDPCPPNPTFDGLAIQWPEKTYINPPFSEYLKWVEHGLHQPLGQIWLCDHDHSTQRFQKLLPGASLCLLFDRVGFIHPETGKEVKGNPRCQTLIYRGRKPFSFANTFWSVGTIVEVAC